MMERYNNKLKMFSESPDIDLFLVELKRLCEKHNLSISHEDGHGAFEFDVYNECNIEWIECGHDNRS